MIIVQLLSVLVLWTITILALRSKVHGAILVYDEGWSQWMLITGVSTELYSCFVKLDNHLVGQI